SLAHPASRRRRCRECHGFACPLPFTREVRIAPWIGRAGIFQLSEFPTLGDTPRARCATRAVRSVQIALAGSPPQTGRDSLWDGAPEFSGVASNAFLPFKNSSPGAP